MSDNLDRIVGQLEGKYDSLQADVTEIKQDIKKLLQSKWKADGRNGAIAASVAGIFTVLGWFLK
jgi:hypothetical protein